MLCEGLLAGSVAPAAAALEREGHEAIVVDPFTSTDPASYTFAALADTVADATGGRPAVALGASLGAGAAVALARRRPECCLALALFQPVFLYGARTELRDLAGVARRLGAFAPVWQRLFGSDARPPAHDDALVLAALEGLGSDALLEGPDDLRSIAQPTLLVARAGDALHAMEVATAYWRHIPTTRMVNEVPGDVPFWDRPADLAVLVDRFLAEVLPH